jgi:hypothetical protein
MGQRVSGLPENQAKPPWIAQSHDAAVVDDEVEMIVFFRRGCGINEPQPSGHAQVYDQRPGDAIGFCAVEQQVLATSPQRHDSRIRELTFEAARNRQSHASVAYDGAFNPVVFHRRSKAAACSLYFG